MKKVIVILGPTAVGKTKISIDVAKHFGYEIISGDSVAIYKRLDIGSAKPTKHEMNGVKHYLIDIKDPKDDYSVSEFQRDARQIIDSDDNIKIIAGGTGLYIQSVLLDYEFTSPKRDENFAKEYENYSNEELYNILLKSDSNIDKEKLHMNNRKRVLRALEVLKNSNRSIHSYNNKDKKVYDYYICYLSMPRELLYDRINKRVDKMIEDGLVDEVYSLYKDGIYPHAIGYQELKKYFDNELSLESAIEDIKKNSRHLAKRQETWFKNQLDTHFYEVDPNDVDFTTNKIISDLKEWLK